MRIRKPFAGAFAALILISGYLGLSTTQIPQYNKYRVQSDKVLHFVTFFLLTLTFYWIIETSRRRIVHITLVSCTGVLSVGSEVVQALLPNNRDFDPFDVAANILGSLAALGLCAFYHKRMLERRRAAKGYSGLDGNGEGAEDLELGEGTGPQETGITTGGQRETNVDEELDNWDEHAADDWDDDDDAVANGKTDKTADKK